MIVGKHYRLMVAYKSNALDGIENHLDKPMNAFDSLGNNGIPHNLLIRQHNTCNRIRNK